MPLALKWSFSSRAIGIRPAPTANSSNGSQSKPGRVWIPLTNVNMNAWLLRPQNLWRYSTENERFCVQFVHFFPPGIADCPSAGDYHDCVQLKIIVTDSCMFLLRVGAREAKKWRLKSFNEHFYFNNLKKKNKRVEINVQRMTRHANCAVDVLTKESTNNPAST